jgi:hypothetical protein
MGADATGLVASATSARAATSAAKQELPNAMLNQMAKMIFIRVIGEHLFRLKNASQVDALADNGEPHRHFEKANINFDLKGVIRFEIMGQHDLNR